MFAKFNVTLKVFVLVLLLSIVNTFGYAQEPISVSSSHNIGNESNELHDSEIFTITYEFESEITEFNVNDVKISHDITPSGWYGLSTLAFSEPQYPTKIVNVGFRSASHGSKFVPNTGITIKLLPTATSPENNGRTMTFGIGRKSKVTITPDRRHIKPGQKVTVLITFDHPARRSGTGLGDHDIKIRGVDNNGVERINHFMTPRWGNDKTARNRGIFKREQFAEYSMPDWDIFGESGTITITVLSNAVPKGIPGWWDDRYVMGNNPVSCKVTWGN